MRTWAVTIGIVSLDQLVKWFVRRGLEPGEGFTVLAGLFDVRYVRNTGAAWGLLAGQRLFLIVFSLFALAALFIWYRRPLAKLPAGELTLGLLAGGIVGNLIDRVALGYVVDYLDFYWGDVHFPTFNLADAAICTGVGLYLLTQWLFDRRSRPRSAGEAT